MDDLLFYVLFNSISIILGLMGGDNKMLYAMEARLRLKRFPTRAGLDPGTARSAGQRITL